MGSLTKYAPVAGLGLVVVVILILVASGDDDSTAPVSGIDTDSVGSAPLPKASPLPKAQGQGGSAGGNAPMLESLVTGLESKVKADPGNVNNRLLLAQTYSELGRQDDALKMLEELRASNDGEPRVKLVSAMVLAKGENPQHLQQALTLLSGLEEVPGAQVGQVYLQRGKVQKKMGQADKAKATWQQGLDRVPESDPVRKELQQALAGG